MKILVKQLSIFVIALILSLNVFLCSTLKNKIKSKAQQEMEQTWQTLFHSSRGQSCKSSQIARRAMSQIKAAALEAVTGVKSKKGKFAWVEDWGYGKTAYLLDFFDPVLIDDILKEFLRIYNDFNSYDNQDTTEYKDPFDFKKLLSKNDKSLSKKVLANLKLLNKNYEPEIYNVSINAVQIHKGMIDWKWAVDLGLKDFAKSFIKKYDMNGDGRLNPRELILAALHHNQHLLGSGICTHCFEYAVKKIDAIFTYVDCDNDGLVSAEDLWNNLTKLKRDSDQYNIFALGKEQGIRTDCVNDFVLKNNRMTPGALNKVEFRMAILYGFWDRQTNFYKILDDDTRALKDLRWKDEYTIDIKTFDTLKEIAIRDLKSKLH